MSREILAIFAKTPVPGRVKTRLSPPLTAAQAADVYAACLRDVVEQAQSISSNVLIIREDEPGAHEYFTGAFPGTELATQSAGDLGARMQQALEPLLAGPADRVVIIGGDSPTLPGAHLREALDALRHVDVVVGPALDGGYYLIGIRRSAWPEASRLFEGIHWSTPTVLAETLQRIDKGGFSIRLLPEWYDIDRPADLERARRDAAGRGHLGRLLSADIETDSGSE